MKTNIFYRPPWTCGKYNDKKNVAIFFNLLSKMNYFYENESAEVINCVLSVGRYGKVSVKEVSDKCNIDEESIYNFFNDLCSAGLLVDREITDEIITDYRKSCKDSKQDTVAIGTRAKELTENGVTSAYHAFANAVNRLPVIIDVMFELTYRCQAQCVHCYNPGATRNDSERSGRADTEELSLEDYKRIIDDLCDNGLTSVTLTGGDPFMHPYIWQIIDYLYQKEIATSVYTNGLGLVGKEEKLAAYYPYTVQCSLYSGEAKVHDKITRKQGSWQRTVSVMDKLHDLSVPLEVSCPIMQTNLKSYFGVKPYVQKYRPSLPTFDVMLTDSIDGDKCVSKHLRLTPEQLSVVLLDQDVIQHINMGKNKDAISVNNDFLNGAPCGAADNAFCINPNGDVTPCCAFHKVLGNIKKNSIKEIAKDNDFIKQWKNITEKDYKECYSHDYCKYCTFCPGHNYNDNKSGEYLNGGENNCYLAKIKYNTVMRLRNGEDILKGMTIEEAINKLEVIEDNLQHEYKS